MKLRLVKWILFGVEILFLWLFYNALTLDPFYYVGPRGVVVLVAGCLATLCGYYSGRLFGKPPASIKPLFLTPPMVILVFSFAVTGIVFVESYR
jgi:hypothetical protein